MSIKLKGNDRAYGLGKDLIGLNPEIIVAHRNPTVRDEGHFGQVWVNTIANTAYICTSKTPGSTIWAQQASAVGNLTIGGTVTAGTGLVVTAGGATIGGNSTVTGSFDATTTITAGTGATITAGNCTLTNGELVISTAAKGITLPGVVRIMTGAGVPANGLATVKGCMYIRTDAGAAAERIYIATALNTWTNVTCAA